MANIIKVRFLREGCEPYGREYSYLTNEPVAVHDIVQVETKQGAASTVVTAINVPEEEVAEYKDKLKYIIGKKPQESEVLMKIDKEEAFALIAGFAEKHPLAIECGSEYIYQNDKAQVDAIDLVANIFDNLEG